MSAPLPISGAQPLHRGATKSANSVRASSTPPPNLVADYLANPPASLVAAEAVNPLEEEADIDITPQPGIVPAGLSHGVPRSSRTDRTSAPNRCGGSRSVSPRAGLLPGRKRPTPQWSTQWGPTPPGIRHRG